MKTRFYKKLEIPQDTAWQRKTWRSYSPNWLREFVDGVHNIFRWIPTIYKDRDWDDYYILAMLRKKIEHQREYLVKANRHMDIERDNRDMTLALNLLERMIEEHYGIEYMDYLDCEFDFDPLPNNSDLYTIEDTVTRNNLDEYLTKYSRMTKKIKKEKPIFQTNTSIAFYVAIENQRKNDRLFWKIMAEKSKNWWD